MVADLDETFQGEAISVIFYRYKCNISPRCLWQRIVKSHASACETFIEQELVDHAIHFHGLTGKGQLHFTIQREERNEQQESAEAQRVRREETVQDPGSGPGVGERTPGTR